MLRRGFTIVELIITITIMGILMVLAVVNISTSQLKARDDARVADIGTIQSYLENYYKTGSPATGVAGTYPTTSLTSAGQITVSVPDADLKAFTAPGQTDPYATFIAATNNTQTTAGVLPQPTIGQFVYQPLHGTGSLCASGTDCRKYNLYYRLEADNVVYTVTSKNQ